MSEKIKTRSLEMHIVDHCNLNCAHCCSMSPLLPEHFVSPSEITRNLGLATRVLDPAFIKLVGGEPLLHPELLECLQAARPYANILSVTTNGFLLNTLNRKADEFWSIIDALTLSVYPKPKLPEHLLQRIKHSAASFNVHLNIKVQNQFSQMLRWRPSEDTKETRELYGGCWLRERCHIVSNGRFYMCTRPPHLDTFFEGKKDFTGDGIILHEGESMHREMQEYLHRENALDTCRYCNGGDAVLSPHRIMPKKEIETILEQRL